MSYTAHWLFQNIHTKNLVYNTCWEDPRCDRQLLQLQPDSRVVMITSAGCNALDYLLDMPQNIDCIDMNPRQNALLELKKAAFKELKHPDLFQIFGRGYHADFETLYQAQLRPFLPHYAQNYWDKNSRFFVGKGLRKSFYHHGTSGLFAWLFTHYLTLNKKDIILAEALFNASDLATQQAIYAKLEPKILNRFVKWALNQSLVMYLLGVPNSQKALLSAAPESARPSAAAFIQRSLRQVFTQLPLQDNYFWQLYFHGAYPSEACAPNYLKATHFDLLSQNVERITTHTHTLTGFLKAHPGAYSHFVLLDHQDWLAAHNQAALYEEWAQILQNSRSGTRILLRSAAYTVDFFPDFVKEKVVFDTHLTAQTHLQDRVGTYGSVYLAIVK